MKGGFASFFVAVAWIFSRAVISFFEMKERFIRFFVSLSWIFFRAVISFFENPGKVMAWVAATTVMFLGLVVIGRGIFFAYSFVFAVWFFYERHKADLRRNVDAAIREGKEVEL